MKIFILPEFFNDLKTFFSLDSRKKKHTQKKQVKWTCTIQLQNFIMMNTMNTFSSSKANKKDSKRNPVNLIFSAHDYTELFKKKGEKSTNTKLMLPLEDN